MSFKQDISYNPSVFMHSGFSSMSKDLNPQSMIHDYRAPSTWTPSSLHVEDLPDFSKLTSDEVSIYQEESDSFVGSISTWLNTVLQAIDIDSTFKWAIASATTSAVITMITNVMTLLSSRTSALLKGLCVASTVSILTTLVMTFKSVSQKMKIAFDAEKVINYVPTLIKSLFTSDKSSDIPNSFSAIKPIIVAIVSVLLMGTTGYNPFVTTDIIKISAVIKGFKEVKSAASDIIDYLVTEICEVDLYGDVAIKKELSDMVTETAKHLQTPAFNYALDATLAAQLRTIHQRAKSLSSHQYKDAKTAGALRNLHSMLNTNISQLHEKITIINDMLGSAPRQATVGLLLSGKPGVGKSTLVNHLTRIIADKMGYRHGLYNINKNDGFYTTYAGQDFGVFNEFGAKVGNDPVVSELNDIISGDPKNFEAANVHAKTQPCQLKLCILTSNIVSPTFTETIKPEALTALWDRVIRVEVVDDDFNGRQGDNKHRRDDFSHLKFYIYPTNEPNPNNLACHKTAISLSSLITNLMIKMARNETRHLTYTLPNHKVDLAGEPLKFDINDPYVRNRIGYLESFLQGDKPNAGDNYFVIRLQGPPGAGKTHYSRNLANLLATTVPNSEVNIVKNFLTKPNPDKICVYLLDDMLTDDQSYIKYMHWLSTINQNSIVIICTNHIFKPTSTYRQWALNKMSLGFYNPRMHYDLKNFRPLIKCPGLIRRIGLSGLVKAGYNSTYVSSTNNICIDFDNNMRMYKDNICLQELEVTDYIWANYKQHIVSTGNLYVVRKSYPGQPNFDISVQSEDLDSLATLLRSPSVLIAAFMNSANEGQIRISAQALSILSKKTVSVEDWLVAEKLKTMKDFEGIATKMAALLYRKAPNLSVLLKCGDEFTMALIDGVIYMSDDLSNNLQLVGHVNGFDIRVGMEIYSLTYQEVAEYAIGDIHTIPKNIPPTILEFLLTKLKQNSKKYPLYEKALWDANQRKSITSMIESQIYQAVLKHPFVKIAGVLAVSLITGYGIHKLYQAFTKKDDKVEPNGALDDYFPEAAPFIQRFQKSVLDKKAMATLRTDLDNQPAHVQKQFNEWEAEMRNNYQGSSLDVATDRLSVLLASTKRAFATHDVSTIGDLCIRAPEVVKLHLRRTGPNSGDKANLLRMKDLVTSMPSPVEIMTRKIHRALVKVTTVEGTNYGIMIKNNIGITVSHSVTDLSTYISIRDNGIDYSAKAIAIHRKRDLAFFEILDKSYPSSPDITSFFHKSEECELNMECYFVKPVGDGNFIAASGKPTFTKDRSYYGSSSSLYTPIQDQIMLNFINVSTISNFLSTGDCGLPLIGFRNNQPYLLGIHNGYNSARNYVLFSGINQHILEAYTYHTETSNSYSPFKTITLPNCDIDFSHPMEYDEYLTFGYAKSKFSNSARERGLHLLGYNKAMHLYSDPSDRKQFHPIEPALDFPKDVLPAAINTKNVKDFSALTPDNYGVFTPLWSQCLNYTLSTGEEGTFDPEICQAVESILSTEIEHLFPERSTLRLFGAINKYKHLNPLDMTTSAGTFNKLKYGITTKRPKDNPNILFKDIGSMENPVYEINRDTEAGKTLFNQIMTTIESIEKGIPPLNIIKDNAKVELLPKEKVENGKVRLFNELDLYMNMVYRMYFGNIVSTIFENHVTYPYAMGSNPYLDATPYMLQFDEMPGRVISSDFKNLDKTIPAYLISRFVHMMRDDLPYEQREAIANSLIYTYHVINGNCYLVDRGNESGSYVTTLLNVFVVDYVNTYTFARKWRETYGYFPSYSEFSCNVKRKILGDDAIRKFSPNCDINFEDCKGDCAKFGLILTEAKEDAEYSFCSRAFIRDEKYTMIVRPALAKRSITSALYWYQRHEIDVISCNINVAMFEASMHDKAFFDRVKKLCIIKAKQCNIMEMCNFYSYEIYRQRFVHYIYGMCKSPTLQAVGGSGVIDIYQTIIEDFDKVETPNNTIQTISLQEIEKMDKWLNEYVQRYGLQQPQYTYTKSGPDERLTWTAGISLLVDKTTHYGAGTGFTKSIAKRSACEDIYKSLRPNSALFNTGRIAPRDQLYLEEALENVEYEVVPLQQALDELSIHEEAVEAELDKDPSPPEYVAFSTKACKLDDLLELVKRKQINSTDKADIVIGDDEEIPHRVVYMKKDPYYGYVEVGDPRELWPKGCPYDIDTPNSDNNNAPIQPAGYNQAATSQSVNSIPSNTSAQPTNMTPAMAPAGQAINATQEIIQQTTLNPQGTPNMMGAGGVSANIFNICYEEFLDMPNEIEVSDSATAGTILFQIPYAMISLFTNPFIQAIGMLHERYSGSMEFRITGIGNQLFSGSIILSWQPKRIKTPTASAAMLQRFSAFTVGINEPFVHSMQLHDARKEHFYREVSDDINDDLSNRPHLVCAVYVTFKNPYNTAAVVRFKIGSKLANGTSNNPFLMSLPVVGDINIGPNPVNNTALFKNVFTNAYNSKIYLYTDGIYEQGEDFSFTKAYNQFSIFQQPGTGLGRGTITFRNGNVLNYTGQTWAYNKTILAEHWPSLTFPTTTNEQVAFTSYNIFHTMSADALQDILRHCPFGGGYNDSPSPASVISEERWKGIADNTTRWVEKLSRVNVKVMLVNISAKLNWSDTAERFTKATYSVGYVKIVTDQGTMWIVPRIYWNATTNLSEEATLHMFSNVSSFEEGNENKPWTIPYIGIDQTLGYISPTLQQLPDSYINFKLTSIPPTAVPLDQYSGPTSTDDADIWRRIQTEASILPIDQTIQFDIQDARSYSIIATVRYMREYGCFVIRNDTAPLAYASLNIDIDSVLIANLRPVQRGSDFPVTNQVNWLKRKSTIFRNNYSHIHSVNSDVDISNSGMGSLAGIGSLANAGAQVQGNILGFGRDYLNYTYDVKKQQNSFNNQNQMLDKTFDFGKYMQEKSLLNQNQMQNKDFANQNHMQNKNFTQQHFLQSNQFKQEKDMQRTNFVNQATYKGISSQVAHSAGFM
jgi:broad-specificity NMP kinase